MQAALTTLHGELATGPPSALVLRLLGTLRVTRADLLAVPVGRYVKGLAKQGDGELAEAARALMVQWQALLRGTSPPPAAAAAPPVGRRAVSRARLLAGCTSVDGAALASDVEEAAYAAAQRIGGVSSSEKLARYVDQVARVARGLSERPLLQALGVARALPAAELLDEALGRGDGGKCASESDAALLRRIVRGIPATDSNGRPPRTRCEVAAAAAPSDDRRRALLAHIASKRAKTDAPHGRPQPAAAATSAAAASAHEPASAAAIALVLPRLPWIDCVRVGAVCVGWRDRSRDGELWAGLARARWGISIQPSSALREFRGRHLAGCTRLLSRLEQAAKAGDVGTLDHWLRLGLPVDTQRAHHRTKPGTSASTLLLAAMSGQQWEAVTWLLERWHADGAAADEMSADRPLHVAARDGATEMVRTLMLYGGLTHIDARNRVGHVALHLAGARLLLCGASGAAALAAPAVMLLSRPLRRRGRPRGTPQSTAATWARHVRCSSTAPTRCSASTGSRRCSLRRSRRARVGANSSRCSATRRRSGRRGARPASSIGCQMSPPTSLTTTMPSDEYRYVLASTLYRCQTCQSD